MSLLQRPRAVITGAGHGLGRALGLELAKRKAKVLVSDLDAVGARRTAELITEAGGTAKGMICDVSKPDDVALLLSEARSYLGSVDLLINNAGVAVGGSIGQIPLADWEWIVGINLWGVIYGCNAFVPEFLGQRAGHILNIASAAGLLAGPGMAPYNVTKAAVVALSETLRGELSEHGVGVTVLCPTFFDTGILDNSRSHRLTDGMRNLVRQSMSESSLQAEDVARIALAACDANRLYAVPMRDGKWLWRFKRLAPEAFYAYFPRLLGFLVDRAR